MPSSVAVEPGAPREAAIKIADIANDGDLNKDGKIDEFERRALQAIQAADADGSGYLTGQELLNVMRTLVESGKTQSMLKKGIGTLFIIVLALIGAMLGVTLAANEVSKESHVKGSAMTTLSGGAVQTDSVVSFSSVWDIPALPTTTLRELEALTVYLTPAAAGAGLASEGELEATLKVTSAFKPTGSTTKAYLTTAAGALVFVDGAASTGTLTLADGTVFTIGASSAARRRKLADAQPERLLWTSEAALASGHDHDRRLGFGVRDSTARALSFGVRAPARALSFTLAVCTRASRVSPRRLLPRTRRRAFPTARRAFTARHVCPSSPPVPAAAGSADDFWILHHV